MIISLVVANIVWFGVITAIVLSLKNKKQLSIDNNHFNFDENGGLIIKGKLPNIYNKKPIYGIFIDENNQEHKIKAIVNDKGEYEFNTKELDSNHTYKLKHIVDGQDLNKTLVKNEELNIDQKVTFSKPTKAQVKFVNNKKVYEVQLVASLKNTLVELTLKDLNNRLHKIRAKTNQAGIVVFDVSTLNENNAYEVISIKNMNKVNIANVLDIPYYKKTINNLNTNILNAPYQYTKDGDINLVAKVLPHYANQNVFGIFKDQNNQEHQILAKVKNDGTIEFDTKNLRKINQYTLDRIVSVLDKQVELAYNFDLTNKQKQSINKPAGIPSINKDKHQLISHLNSDLVKQKLIATFVDNNNQEHKIEAVVSSQNQVDFDTSSLPKGYIYIYIYTLNKVVNIKSNKVLNVNDFELSQISIDKRFSEEDHRISRPNWEYDNDGNLEIHIKLAEDLNKDLKQKAQKNGSVKTIVVDQDGNEHEIDTSVNQDGKVVIKTKNLPSGNSIKSKTYTIKKVILKQDGQANKDLIDEKQLSGDNHTSFKKPTIIAKVKDNNDYEISFSNPNLVNKKVKLTFRVDNKDNNLKIIEAIVGLNGKANFITSDDLDFAPNHKYTLTKITIDDKKIANIDEIPLQDRVINKQRNVILNELQVANDSITWDANTNKADQLITAKILNVNSDYNNRNAKLIYEYNYRGTMVEVESSIFKLEENKTIYENIVLSTNVPNRKYIFKKIVIQNPSDPLVYTNLDMKNSLANTFVVQPGKTWIDWVPPTDEQITNYYLKNFNIKIKSEDKAFENNKRVHILFKTLRGDNIEYECTAKLTNISVNGDEAIIENVHSNKDFFGDYEIYIAKIELLDDLAYANKTNKIIYSCDSKKESQYKFKTKPYIYQLVPTQKIDPWYDSVNNKGHFRYYISHTYSGGGYWTPLRNLNSKFKVVFRDRNEPNESDKVLVASNLSLIKDNSEENLYYIEGVFDKNVERKHHYYIKAIYISHPTSDNLFDEDNNSKVDLGNNYNSSFSSYEIKSKSSYFGDGSGSGNEIINESENKKTYDLNLEMDYRYHNKYLRAVYEYYDATTNKYEYLYSTPIKLDFFDKYEYKIDFEKTKNTEVWKKPRVFNFKKLEYSDDSNNNWKTFECQMDANRLEKIRFK
ncbi:DUF1410 domain-containing protein [Ureaplasma urealyticum]